MIVKILHFYWLQVDRSLNRTKLGPVHGPVMKFGLVCGPLLGPGLLNRDQTRTDRNIPIYIGTIAL